MTWAVNPRRHISSTHQALFLWISWWTTGQKNRLRAGADLCDTMNMHNVPPTRAGILWDLDSCLYEDPPEMPAAWLNAFWQAAQDFSLPLTQDQCNREMLDGSRQHGNAIRHYAITYQIAEPEFLAAVIRHMDEKIIAPCQATAYALASRMHIPMAIVSSGAKHWVDRVVPHIGLARRFPVDCRVALEDSGHEQKSHSERPFLMGAAILGLPPEQCIFPDDHPKNLVIAKQLGMCTIQVTHGKVVDRAPHVDHVVAKPAGVFDLIERGVIPFVGYGPHHRIFAAPAP